LLVLLAGSLGADELPLNGGVVPVVAAEGVTGTLIVIALFGATLLNGPGVKQVTVCPDVLQVLPPLTKVAGADTPAGSVMVVVIGPVAGPVPTFVVVTGTLLGCPTTNGVAGWPTVVIKSGTAGFCTGVLGVIGVEPLLLVLLTGSLGADELPLNAGVVPTVAAEGVTGTLIVIALFGATLLNGPGVKQVTVCPDVLQLLPPLVKVAGADTPAGSVMVVVIGPVAGPEPTFVVVTGILLTCPTVNGVAGWPTVVIKSGVATFCTGVVGVIGVEPLLPVLLAGSLGADEPPLNAGVVPAVAAEGVTGTLIVIALFGATLLNPLGVKQVTVCPDVLQVLPPLAKVAGADTPVGSVMVVVIGPVAGPEPTFVVVTGILLTCPTVNGVAGWPTVVTKSGTPATGVLGVVGVAALLPVLLAGSFGAEDVPLNVGVVPAVAAEGVTGTLIVIVLLGAVLLNGPGVLQVTVWPEVVQLLPPLVKVAGADVPAGNVMVVVIGPVAGPEPMLVVVTGTLLTCPTINGVAGWPTVVTKSGAGAFCTGVLGVIGVALLLPVLLAGSFGADEPPLNAGVVPAVAAEGVTGTLITMALLPAVLLNGPGVKQVTVCPDVLQVLPPLVKLLGADTPEGSVIVVVIGPVAGPVPTFVVVTGILLTCPTVKAVAG
jgi:hypothetical protein